MVTLEEFLSFHKDHYLPAYSELVAFLADKPIQVLIEIENLSAHLFNYLNSNHANKEENLEKAYNHLVRVTIDCYKLLWMSLDKEMSRLLESPNWASYLLVPEELFLQARLVYKRSAIAARSLEMRSIGADPTECYKLYAQVIYFGFDMLKQIDLSNLSASMGEIPPDDYRSPHAPAYETFEDAVRMMSEAEMSL